MRYYALLLSLLFFSTARAQEEEYVRVPLEVALQDTNFKKVVDFFDHTVWTLDKCCVSDSCSYGNDSSYFIIARWIPVKKGDTFLRVGYCDSLFYSKAYEGSWYTLAGKAHKPGIALKRMTNTSPLTFDCWYGDSGWNECSFTLISKNRFSLSFPLADGGKVVNYYKPIKPDEAAMNTLNHSFEHLMK